MDTNNSSQVEHQNNGTEKLPSKSTLPKRLEARGASPTVEVEPVEAIASKSANKLVPDGFSTVRQYSGTNIPRVSIEKPLDNVPRMTQDGVFYRAKEEYLSGFVGRFTGVDGNVRSYYVTDAIAAELKESLVFKPLTLNRQNFYEAYWFPITSLRKDFSGAFALFEIKAPIVGNDNSERAYLNKLNFIQNATRDWIRRDKTKTMGICSNTPGGGIKSEPIWPKEVLKGETPSLLSIAFNGEVINSLNHPALRLWLNGTLADQEEED